MEGHPEIKTKAKPALETLRKSKGSQVFPLLRTLCNIFPYLTSHSPKSLFFFEKRNTYTYIHTEFDKANVVMLTFREPG